MITLTQTRALLTTGRERKKDFHPIRWSGGYMQSFQDIIDGKQDVRTPVDVHLAPILVAYARGEISSADSALTQVGVEFIDKAASDQETFISLLFAYYVAQRFEITSSLLAERFHFVAPLHMDASADGPGESRVIWSIDAAGAHRLVFDSKSYQTDKTRNDILTLQWTFPLIAHYARSADHETGAVIINQGDLGNSPGLAFCDNRPNYFLIPDCIFIPSRGYAWYRTLFAEKALRWTERAPIAMWRGATTGIRTAPNDWRSLERVRMCESLRGCSSPQLFDVGLSSVIQFSDPAVFREVEDSGLKGDFIPADRWSRYKYLIDIDGNSSPWSNLFQRLLTGSVVLKVESSRGLQQWYYDSLKPWENYVPIAPDFSDMVEKVEWLVRHDRVAEAIGRAGRDLANKLTYEREMDRSIPVISAAFRYFRGNLSDVAPFGRVCANDTLRHQ